MGSQSPIKPLPTHSLNPHPLKSRVSQEKTGLSWGGGGGHLHLVGEGAELSELCQAPPAHPGSDAVAPTQLRVGVVHEVPPSRRPYSLHHTPWGLPHPP